MEAANLARPADIAPARRSDTVLRPERLRDGEERNEPTELRRRRRRARFGADHQAARADRLPLGASRHALSRSAYGSTRQALPAKVGNAAIERIATGFRWAEGPVYFRDGGYLLWSDIPNNRIMRWLEDDGHVSVFRSPSNFSNGNTRDREGRLITCEHDTRRVTRTEPDGRITVLIDSFDGKQLNAPNDVVVSSDGAIWFTDPGYGISAIMRDTGHAELPPQVYRLDLQSGRANVVGDGFDEPNGIALSPDEKNALYHRQRHYPWRPDRISALRCERRHVCPTIGSSPRVLRRVSPMVSASTSTAMSGAAWAGGSRRRTGSVAMSRAGD